jgi:spore germination cell wall hydrolase CwlJ-like protein
MYSITKKAIILAILIIIPKASFAESLIDESEKTCLAKVIYNETRGEPLSGKKGVAKVVLNRKSDKHFPKTICNVVNQVAINSSGRKVCQFSWVCTRPKIKLGSAEWKSSLKLSNDILNNKVSLPDFGSDVLFFRSINCRRGFGRGNYKLVSKLGKTNFYTKKIA